MWIEQARLLFLIIKNGTAGQMRGIFATRATKQAAIRPLFGGTNTHTSEVTQDT